MVWNVVVVCSIRFGQVTRIMEFSPSKSNTEAVGGRYGEVGPATIHARDPRYSKTERKTNERKPECFVQHLVCTVKLVLIWML